MKTYENETFIIYKAEIGKKLKINGVETSYTEYIDYQENEQKIVEEY